MVNAVQRTIAGLAIRKRRAIAQAGMAATPEQSDHTSIKERINPTFDLAAAIREQHFQNEFELPLKPLTVFEGAVTAAKQSGMLYSLSDNLQLVDWTGRIIREDKRGTINNALPPFLQDLISLFTNGW